MSGHAHRSRPTSRDMDISQAAPRPTSQRSSNRPLGNPPRFEEVMQNDGVDPAVAQPDKAHAHHHEKSGQHPHVQVTPIYPPGPRPPYARSPEMLYSYGSNVMRSPTDPNTERLIAHRATQSTLWHIHWRTPSMIAFSLFAGVVCALLQHFLYRWLHHRVFDEEIKKFRAVLYGRALAYLAKVCFGGCVVLVFRQRIWRTFRQQALSVLTIDQFFGATEDPTLFGNYEALRSAPVLIMIAAVIWIIPLATIIFSPGALTFGDFETMSSHTQRVPTLDFLQETDKDWRYPVPVGDGSTSKRSLMYYNTTDVAGKAPGWFDYYDQPSAELKRIALLMAYSNEESANVNATARGNSTYEQSFIAPGYQCLEVTNRISEVGAPFNSSVLVPTGKNIYHAEVDHGTYLQPQNATFQDGPGGIPVGEPPQDLGVFKSEPILWIGYAVNSTKWLASDDPLTLNWTHRYDPHIVKCTHMETRYTIRWNWTEPKYTNTIQREYLKPIIDTNLTANGDPEPSSNYVSPRTDVARYKKVAAYHAVGEMFRQFLRGTVDLKAPRPGPSYALVYSDITKTRLVQPNVHPKENLTAELESFYTDLVLSVFSLGDMLVVANETLPVNQTTIHSSFVYVPIRLWQCYAPVIFVTLLIALFGALTIWEDGTTFSTGFSRILVTTRNTTLDDISRGACLGNDPFPRELMNTRLRFGALAGSGHVGLNGEVTGHCAFGVESEVGEIQRGVRYAGFNVEEGGDGRELRRRVVEGKKEDEGEK